MKKVITIVAALFVAAAAQAASIDWAVTGAGAVKYRGDTSNVGGGWTVYLVLTDKIDDIVDAIGEGSFGLSTTGVLGSSLTGSGSNIGVPTPVTITNPQITAGVEYRYTVLFFNEAYTGVEGSQGSYKLSLSTDLIPAYTGDTTTQATFIGSYAGAGGHMSNGAWYNYTVIPEPTAMALLALGAAAVGLRRRFRK